MKKTWFITGASRGFGRIWAEAALKRGDLVTATARKLAMQHDLTALQADQPQLDTTSSYCVSHHGWQPYWRARTQALQTVPAQPCTPYETAVDDLRANDPDDAFRSFQYALESHCLYMALIRVDPLLDSVRNDSRYADLVKRISSVIRTTLWA